MGDGCGDGVVVVAGGGGACAAAGANSTLMCLLTKVFGSEGLRTTLLCLCMQLLSNVCHLTMLGYCMSLLLRSDTTDSV